ncbi:MAG: lysine--tRNA ligase [Candidatus Zixiibacteriota bacterium]|nr:MAG: lysine--tRNA ligase [candidate division Zixibacteria bacterium]
MTKPDKKPGENQPDQPQLPLAELMKIRYEKIKELNERKISSYPYRYERTHVIRQALDNFDEYAEKETVLRVAGRIMLKRKMGKSFFAHIQDSSDKIQIYLKFDVVGKEQFDLFNTLDLGDIIGCEGSLFVTKTGERTLRVTTFELLTKALHPLPDKHSGLTDKEQRYRRRYADLIANPEVRETFVRRTRIIKAVRDFLDNEGFLEVETPILQPIYGGGNARPFKTHYMRLDRDMYLRIADELYLKRLIIGGYDKVWEYCKDFRNEGMDRLHNPEFSMIELYWAYADYKDMAALLEKMMREVVHKIHGTYKITYGENEIDFEPPFKWITMLGSVKEQTGIDFSEMSYEQARKAAAEIEVDSEDLINWGKVVAAVWEAKVEPTLVQPTFIVDFPVEISPLAKKHRENPRLTERFELFVAGHELGNAFSELNDPVDQLQRFMQQGKALEAGDEEAQPLDDDFVTALSYGMPPTAGLGLGIDRLVMLLTNQHSIRDVLFFPAMKELGDGSVPVSQILSKIIGDKEFPPDGY